MAGKFEKFDSLVKEFNKNHGVNFSFERYEIKQKQTAHMREFFTKKGTISSANVAYRTILDELFREAVESLIEKKTKSVDHSALFKDFEKLMDNYRQHCKETGNEAPDRNGGWISGVDVVESMQDKIKNIPADKSDFIKDKYIKRSIRLRDMRADLESMQKDGKDATVEELSRAIVYKKALEKAIKERSFGWKLIHWFQGPAERRDLAAINTFLGKYEHSIYYPKAEELAEENVVGDVRSNLEAAKEEIKAKELLKPRRLKDARQGLERMTNQKVTEHVHEQILGAIEMSTSREADKSAISRGLILVGNKNTIKNMWDEFKKATTAEEKENILNNRTQQIFNDTFNIIKKLKGMDERDSIVATQKITNLMLKQYSPATSDKDYDKYIDNYLVSDEKFMENFMRTNFKNSEMSKEELTNFMNELKANLANNTNKEKLKLSDGDITSKDVGKSEKHTDVPKLDAKVKST